MHEISFSLLLIIRLPIVNKLQATLDVFIKINLILLACINFLVNLHRTTKLGCTNYRVTMQMEIHLLHFAHVATGMIVILVPNSSPLFTIGNLIIRNGLKEISYIMNSDNQNFKVGT